MDVVLILISWLILLVPGFDDSIPVTSDKIFKIETSPDIIQSITTRSDETMDFLGFDVELKQNSTGILEIKIPKNLPTPASFTNSWHHDENPIILTDGTEIGYDVIPDPCYSHYKIPVEDKTNLEILYTVILAGSWQLYSPIQFDESHQCYNNVFYEKPLEPPLKQFKSGVPVDEIQCKEILLLIKKYDGYPACVTEQTKLNLIERGWTNNETKNFWKFTSDWNSIKLMRNDNGMYCNSTNEQLSDQCYSLEEIVFRNGFKKYGWKIYPGGGIILPENSTLTPIFKTVEPLGFRQIDLNAMLDDKIFVNKCESNGGIWNYTYHDCEGLIQACNDIGGIYLNDDVTPICNPLDGCDASGLVRVSCVFEYEN